MNIVIVSGNLTRDPELRYLPNGTAISQFTVAVSRRFKKKDNEWDEEVAFVDCEAWGRLGESATEKLSKGAAVMVQGSWKQDSWEKEGKRMRRDKVKVDSFERLTKRPTEKNNASTTTAESNESTEPTAEPATADTGEQAPF